MVTENFADVPEDEDTKTYLKNEISIDGIAARSEAWSWDGIYGKSLVFRNSDIEHLSDQALVDWIVGKGYIKDRKSVTVKRNQDGFAFLNYDFEHED